MATWTAPTLDWASTDYINFDDFNKIEENTEYIYDEMVAHINSQIPTPQVTYTGTYTVVGRSGFKTDRDIDWIDFYDDYFAIDNNIAFLKSYLADWPEWATYQTTRTNWIPLAVIDYTDINRFESNNYYLYLVIQAIITELKICGTAYSGEEIVL